MPTTLSVADWKKQLKASPSALETAAVTKALEAYAKLGDKGDAEKRLTALDEVIDSVKASKKKNAKDKSLAGYLDGLLGDAEKKRDAAEKEAGSSPGEEEEEEGDEAGSLLRSMLLRVKKAGAEKALPFVVALGTVPGMTIARRAPLTREHRTMARSMRKGKGKLLIGQCFGESGKLVFEFPDKPPGGLTKIIKKAAKVHAAMDIRLKVRGPGAEIDDENDTDELTDFGDETEETEDSTEESTERERMEVEEETESNDASIVEERLAEVRQHLEQLKAVNPELTAELTKRMTPSLALAQLGRYEQADDILEEILGEIQEALEAAVADPAEEYQKRVDAITPALKVALQKGGEKAVDVKLKFSEASVFSRKKDFPRANALLDEVDALIGTKTAKPKDPKADWDRLFAVVEPQYLEAVRSQPEKAGSFRAVMSFANGKAEAGDYPKAIEALRRLAASLKADDTGGKETEEESEEGESEESAAEEAFKTRFKAMFARLKGSQSEAVKEKIEEARNLARDGAYAKGIKVLDDLETLLGGSTSTTPTPEKTKTVALWVDARDKVVAQINQLQAAMLSEGQKLKDPGFEVIAREGLAGITKRLQVGLHVALLEYDNASADKKAAFRTRGRRRRSATSGRSSSRTG